MEVYLIRHTTPHIEKGVCYGQSDLDLVETYIEEFKTVESKLPGEFDAYYTSPLKRCLNLTKHLTEDFSTDHRLMEFNFGDWEMKKWDDIPKAHIDQWMKDFVNVMVPSGESMATMEERVRAFFTELVVKEYDRVAVITHSVVIRIVLCHVEGLPLKRAFERPLDYGDVVKVELDDQILRANKKLNA
ncbi:alpha-ribazole phosphatase [Fulvivirga sp. 29W222]|uniref:Alpha-ribazole phosphatase n=1 Tax=Fulvivirga marina TaxID=2494733 RepID=A0A937FW16_9BACT|nr:alpha-ribazole phosphatase [Fulvivirga marina]MBL6447024.1 alpha-ribazole phosphatase [Fulvivirga marina]